MVEAVCPDIYRIEAPLPDNPLRSVNCYVVRGERWLVVDTGMRREECQHALAAGFDELGVDLSRADFFITHLHADHLGLVTEFATETSRVYFNAPEAAFIEGARSKGGFMAFLAAQALRAGISMEELQGAMEQHPGFKYSPPDYPEFTLLADGDVLGLGAYEFRCVHTPGHTPGHLCLYDAERKVLFSGDHVLGDITPNISVWSDDTDMLGIFLASLDKIGELDVEVVLPGHRRVFRDLPGRIGQIKEHHQVRISDVMTVLRDGGMTAYEVASRMKWGISARSWDEFPLMQRWFATGEAAAHLLYMQRNGAVKAVNRDGALVYCL